MISLLHIEILLLHWNSSGPCICCDFGKLQSNWPNNCFVLEFFGWNTWNFISHFLLHLEDVEINVNILLFAVKHELFLSLSFFYLYIYFFSFLKQHNAIKRKVKGKHFYLPYEPFKYIKKCLSVYNCVRVNLGRNFWITTIYHLMVVAYQKRMLKCRHPGFATLGWSDWPIPWGRGSSS